MYKGLILPDVNIDEYRRYRNAATVLHKKIMKVSLDKETIDRAGKWLGIMKKGVLVFDGEDESSTLMDYAFYEVRKHGKSVVQRYQEQPGGQDETEHELLAAMVEAKTALFRVESVSPKMHNVILREVLDARPVILTDLGFSQTLTAGPMVFFRPLQLSKFTMTSGIAFVFPAEMERELRESYRKWQTVDSAERYARFFRLSRSRGLAMQYAPVNKS